MGARSGSIWNPYGNPYGNHISMSFLTNFDLEPYGSHMEVIWKFQTKKNVTRLVLEAYGTHMEIHMEIINPCLKLLTSIWNHMEVIWKSYGNPYGNHISMSYVTNFDLEPYGSHMEVIWKSQTKKNVTRLDLEAYGTHMEIHMEIIFPFLMLLTLIWNHMEVIWKSYGSPKQKKMLLGSFWKHMEPIWKSIWKLYFYVLCY